MAQRPKEEIADRIADAALAVFAEEGYVAATMAAIAARAGISVGNLYRYHPGGKEALFDQVVPDPFVARLRTLLKRRIAALAGVTEVDQLPPGSPFEVASEALLAFALEHRLRVVVALGRAAGSRHAGLGDELVALMRGLAVDHFRALSPGLVTSEALRFDLALIYRHLADATVAILARFEDGAKIRAAIAGYSAYHLAGLARLFAGASGGAGEVSQNRE